MTLRIGSLFSGYGGLDMAVRDALGGGTVVWHSDTKPAARALLDHRHPDIPIYGDMRFVHWGRVAPIDVLVGSWPCQPNSSAGKRLGEDDPRALWSYVAHAIRWGRPKIFIGENVARIASNGELRRVVRSLAALGYVGAWRCVRASDVGAPHRRDRCFVAAVRGDIAADAYGQLLRRESGRSSRPDWSSEGVTGDHGTSGTVRLTLLPTPTQSMTTGAGTSGREGGLNLQSAVARMADRHWGNFAPAVARWELVLGRPAPDPTVISPRTGKPQLSPAFVEWMMGLPQGWVCDVPGLSRAQQLSLLGDGVVPQQGAMAIRSLLAHLAERLSGEVAA